MKKRDGPEIWVDIPDSKQYQISCFGNVRRKLKNGKVRKVAIFLSNYLGNSVNIKINEIRKQIGIHHLMAKAFHLYPTSPTQVLWHKNGFINENYIENLKREMIIDGKGNNRKRILQIRISKYYNRKNNKP